ncbi:MAG: hypothetical protein CSA62_12605, partial [Planctomycetota bacterium]
PSLPASVRSEPQRRSRSGSDQTEAHLSLIPGLALLRASIEGLLFGLDYSLGYEWGEDPNIYSGLRHPRDIEKLPLAIGRQRQNWLDRAARHFELCLRHYSEGHRAITAETDHQGNDFLVFGSSASLAERELLLAQVEATRAALNSGKALGLHIVRQNGRVLVRVRTAFEGTGIPWRGLLPVFDGWAPLGNRLPDASIAGLFPGMTPAEATWRAQLPTRVEAVSATIKVDGVTSDWPTGSKLLLPADPNMDARGYGDLHAVDGEQIHVAADGDHVYFRLDLADDAFAYRPSEATVYQLRGRNHGDRRGQGPSFLIEIRFDSSSPKANFSQGGGPAQAIPFAYSGRVLECSVPRKALQGNLIERNLSFRIRSLHRKTGQRGGDQSRDVILRF